MTNNSKYDYYAYIVFAGKDKKWGRWLQLNLRLYRLPHAHVKRGEEKKNRDERCYPIMHKKEILREGGEGIKSAIERSKYLIVVCSQNALGETAVLDAVIERFTKAGADPSSIIPFIVDADKRPEENCFPLKLQQLCRDKSILGANIYDSGRYNAFLKVVARMHGLKLEELESEDSRRKKRTRKRVAAGLAVLSALLCVPGYYIWDYYVPHTLYYEDYTERYGIPEGIDELSKKEAKSDMAHYAITSRCRKVRELRYEDPDGELIAYPEGEGTDRPSGISYKYSDNGDLDEAVWFDDDGDVLMRLDYINRKTIDVYAGENGPHSDGTYMHTDTYVIDTEKVSGMQDNNGEIIRYLVDYDDEGFMSELRYSSSEIYNTAAADENGIGGLRFVRDEKGRIKEVIYLVNTRPGSSA